MTLPDYPCFSKIPADDLLLLPSATEPRTHACVVVGERTGPITSTLTTFFCSRAPPDPPRPPGGATHACRSAPVAVWSAKERVGPHQLNANEWLI